MQARSKSEIKRQLGKKSFWNPTQLVGETNYASGVAAFNDELSGSSLPELPLNVVVRPKGWELQMMRGLGYTRVALPEEQAGEAVLEHADKVIENKEKSVVGRALAGGLLFGPVGAIVGGMTGMKDKKVDRMPGSFLTIQTKLQKEPLVFIVEEGKVSKVTTFFERYYPGQFATG